VKNDFFHKDVSEEWIEQKQNQKEEHAERLQNPKGKLKVGVDDCVVAIVIISPEEVKEVAVSSGHNIHF